MKYLYRFFPLLLLFPSTVFAGSTGKISGRATDARTGEDLPGVNVVVEGMAFGASTDIDGAYVILNVPPGQYNVTASLVGYTRVQVRDVRVSVDFTTQLNFTLEEGSIELDAIVVQGERTPLIRKDLTNPVASITSETISELPITEISEVIGLQAGITVDNDGAIHIRGGFGNEIVYTINGVNINNPYGNSRSVGVATNSVREVSVSSGTFNAEYGSALSGVVNYVTKDGGSDWSGSLKHLTGDHVSNNTDLFSNIDRMNWATVNRTEVSIGGPIIGRELTFYGSGAYNWNGGHLYGQRLYLPEDTYVTRLVFPTGDPRRNTLSSAPYYFGPLIHDTTDNIGAPRGDGEVVALNWSRSYNLQGNLSYRPVPEIKLKYEFVYDFDERPLNDADNFPNSTMFASRYKPDGRAKRTNQGFLHSIEWEHSLSEKIFYTLRGSLLIDTSRSQAFEDIDDPRYLPTYYLQFLPRTGFLTGGVDLNRQYQTTKTWGAKFDLVAQLFGDHEFKLGADLRLHDVRFESYTIQFRDTTANNATPSFESALQGSLFEPYIPDSVGGYRYYRHKPVQFAVYIQDKIELFSSIILNMGLRYEFFKPDARYNPKISEELQLFQGATFIDQNLTRASNKHMLAPRFSVSYPITDQGTIRFSYGHFYQIGSLSSLYRNPYFRSSQGTPSFGNPDVNPQKSIQYELGLQQALAENLKVEITAYYKDVRDYIFSQRVITPRGDRQYNVLTNLSYANTRGVSISMLKRRSATDLLSASIDYTFQVAEGNRTSPTEEIFFNEQRGRLSETFLVPFSFDRSHTITSTVALGQPDDWSASMIGYFRTGTPYTPEFPSSVVPITFVQNSDRRSVQWNVDLKMEKFFTLGEISYSVFVQVDNLFDTENEQYVYLSTGRALTAIEQTTDPTRFDDLRKRIQRGDVGIVPMNALDSYYANPGNISSPRLVRIGATIAF